MSKHLYTRLHKEFLDKARNFHIKHFCNHLEYSGDFNIDRNKDVFGRVLKEFIDKETGEKNPINHRTVLNILNAGLAPNARASTLEIIAKFLGYGGFDSFSKTSSDKPSRNSLNIILAVVLTVCCMGAVVLFFLSRNQENEVRKIIENANRAQFEAYKALPEINTKDLRKYYTDKGSALKVIEDILKRSSKLKRVINLPADNPSYYTVYEINILKQEEDKILAESKEHWYLRWYNIESDKYEKKYDETNTQLYILRKEKDQWKIDANDFTGTATDIK